MSKKNYTHKPKVDTKNIKAVSVQTTGLMQNRKNIHYVFLFIIGLLTVIVYARAVQYGFIYNWDDAGYILKNDFIKSLGWASISDMFTEFYMHNYHPLTTLSYAFEYNFVGETPWLYHFNNLLFHLANSFLVYVLIKRLTKGREAIALIVAALFALHPMHVESVAWVSERKDVLYTLFYLLSLILYLKYLESGKVKHFLYMTAFFVLSCLSKSAAVTLPVLLFAFDYFNKRSFSIKIIVEKIPLLFISLLFGILAIRSQDTAIQDLTPLLSFFERLMIVFWGICIYLFKAVFPVNLSAFYPYPLKVDDMLPWYYFTAPLIVSAFFLFVWYSRKWGRSIIFGTAFFFITISLVLQLMPVGGAIVAERYTYVPYIGLFFILAFPLNYLYREISQKLKGKINTYLYALCGLILIFTLLSFNRVGLWKDGDVLFTDIIRKYPKLPYAYNNRGFLYFDYYALKVYPDNETKKNAYVQKAWKDYSTAISLDPGYIGAYSNRAVLLYNTGKPNEALSDFNVLLTLDPKHKDGLIGRANTLSSLEMYNEAIPDYDQYLQLNSEDEKAIIWRGIAHTKTGNPELALKDFDQGILLDPGYYEGYYWKGLVLHQMNRSEESIGLFNQAIALNPENFELYSWRGLAFFEIQKYEQAIDDFSTAITMQPTELSNYVNRSLAYNQLSRFHEAFNDLVYAGERGFPVSKSYYDELIGKVMPQ